MESFEEAWGIICSYCKTKITDVAYNTWISRIEPIELDFDKNKAVILVPNDFHRQTITRCYLSLLNEAFEAVFGQIFVIEMKIPEEISVKEEQQAAANAEITDISYEYTFDTFIVGSSNKFAHAACLAVATNPAMPTIRCFYTEIPVLAKLICFMQSATKSRKIHPKKLFVT